MSIHKDKNGTYRVRWREEYKMKSKNFDRKIDAIQFEAKLKAGLKQIEPVKIEKQADKLSFRELSTKWMSTYAEIHKSPMSVIKDKQMLTDHLLPVIGNNPVDKLELRHFFEIQQFLRKKRGFSPKTVNLVLGLCRKILEDGVKWNLITSNPMRGLNTLKIPQQDFSFWTISERDTFLRHCKSADLSLYQIIAFAVFTGLRRGEVEALMWDCVDFERKTITVKRNYCYRLKQLNEYTKGKNIRWIPMNTEVHSILKDRHVLPLQQTIFKFDFQNLVTKKFKPMQRKLGITPITFHDLRHSFASHLVMADVNPFHIKQLLGHSEIKTTMRYMHLAPDFLQGITDKISRK